MLEFCEICKNLLYISVNNATLIKECKNCNNIVENKTSSMKIVESNYKTNNILYQKYYAEVIDDIPINKLLANDPTLPRIIDKNIKAPPNYKHTSDHPVSYIKQIDGTYLWISTKTGEIWH
jgi:DNA-directed RNA polymerase subunit M/transcription elongation factor TFIIS